MMDPVKAAAVDASLVDQEITREAAKKPRTATAQFRIPDGGHGKLQAQVDRAIYDDGAFSRRPAHGAPLIRRWRTAVIQFGRRPCRETRRAFVKLTEQLIRKGYLLGPEIRAKGAGARVITMGNPAGPTMPGIVDPLAPFPHLPPVAESQHD